MLLHDLPYLLGSTQDSHHHSRSSVRIQGIIHRDLKLENFLFSSTSPDSELKMIDFGLRFVREVLLVPFAIKLLFLLSSFCCIGFPVNISNMAKSIMRQLERLILWRPKSFAVPVSDHCDNRFHVSLHSMFTHFVLCNILFVYDR